MKPILINYKQYLQIASENKRLFENMDITRLLIWTLVKFFTIIVNA